MSAVSQTGEAFSCHVPSQPVEGSISAGRVIAPALPPTTLREVN